MGEKMNIDIDEHITSGLLLYCKKNSIDFKKVVEESILQNQLRHNIDFEGNMYQIANQQKLSKDGFKKILANEFTIEDENIKESSFGALLENIPIEDFEYVFTEYRNNSFIVVITKDKTLIRSIKESKELAHVIIEEHQAYCWITAYQTKILYQEVGQSKIIFVEK